jgi:hypothetical protein
LSGGFLSCSILPFASRFASRVQGVWGAGSSIDDTYGVGLEKGLGLEKGVGCRV